MIKTLWAITGMQNIGPDSCVVDAGSGSGAHSVHAINTSIKERQMEAAMLS